MSRPCIVGWCPHPAVPGRGRCYRHGPSNATRSSKDYGWAWQQLRARAERTLPKVCGLCGRPIIEGELTHLDHIVPRSLGGLDTIENVQWTHQRCNISKGGANRLKK